MNSEDFTHEFRRRLATHRIWQHPFFALLRSHPTIFLLQRWAIQAGRIDQAFALILDNMIKNPAISPKMHHPIQENLQDELGNGDPTQEHFTLFRNVLQELQISEDEYLKTPMTKATKQIITSLTKASCNHNSIQILAMMASEELLCPQEFPLLLDVIEQFVPKDQLSYFYVHISADCRHANDLIRLCYFAANGREDLLKEIFMWQEIDLQNNILFYDDLLTLLNKKN